MSDEADQITTPPAAASPVAPGTLDRSGVPFDPARHIAKTHPRTGNWMPRGGRKPKPAAPSSSSPASSSPADSSPSPSSPSGAGDAPAHVQTVTADDLIPLKDGPKPSAPVNVEGEKPLHEIGPGETPAGVEPQKTAQSNPSGPDVKAGHDLAGELAARVTYAATGVLIGDHKKATATGDEHKTLREGFAAFFAHRGVVFVGTIALVLLIVSFLMGETRRDEVISSIRRIFGKKKTPQTVVEVEAKPTNTPAAKPGPGQPGFDPFA